MTDDPNASDEPKFDESNSGESESSEPEPDHRPNLRDGPDSGLGRVEYDSVTDAYYANYADETPPSTVVPRAMAMITGREVDELRPLQEVLDPDALDDVFDDRGGPDRSEEIEVSFGYLDYEVTVCSSGAITFRADEA